MNEYLPYLIELRTRLIRLSALVFLLFMILFWQDEALYSFIAKPLLSHLKDGARLIATEVTTPFTIPLRLAFITAFFLAIPYMLYELWAFIAPGLYKKEKFMLLPILIASISLFYCGATFAYFVICPMALQFFTNTAPKGVLIMTDIRHYLDFVLTVLLGAGLAFQVPVITVCLLKTNVVTLQQMRYLRPYVIVAAFILGMLLTPPDIISQILLALPMWGLFEGSLFISAQIKKADNKYRPESEELGQKL